MANEAPRFSRRRFVQGLAVGLGTGALLATNTGHITDLPEFEAAPGDTLTFQDVLNDYYGLADQTDHLRSIQVSYFKKEHTLAGNIVGGDIKIAKGVTAGAIGINPLKDKIVLALEFDKNVNIESTKNDEYVPAFMIGSGDSNFLTSSSPIEIKHKHGLEYGPISILIFNFKKRFHRVKWMWCFFSY